VMQVSGRTIAGLRLAADVYGAAVIVLALGLLLAISRSGSTDGSGAAVAT